MNITGKQSRAARALLKWNLHDLASRTRVLAKRIDSFEKAMCHLHKGEHDEVVRVFVEAGIEFLPDFEVILNRAQKAENNAHISHSTVVIDEKGNTSITFNTTAARAAQKHAEMLDEKRSEN